MWVSRILFCSDLLIYCPSPTTEFCLLCMQYPPFCDPTLQVCEPWTKPKPEDCKTDPSYATVDCYVRRDQNSRTPSFIQGYGRPELKNVIWSNYSTYSIWLEETYIPHGYQRTWIFPILKTSREFPVKVTLVWTGECSFVGSCALWAVALVHLPS